MAVPTVALDFPRPSRLGNTPMGLNSGLVTISSYDTAHPEVIAVTGQFLPGGKLRVAPNGLSSNGYMVFWDAVTKSFKAYKLAGTATLNVSSGTPGTHPLGVTSGGGVVVSDATYASIGGIAFNGLAATEASAADNVGTVQFIAVGQLG